MTWGLFAAALLTGVAVLAAVLQSWLRPAWRVWPPGRRGWRHALMWALFVGFSLSEFALAVCDYNALAERGLAWSAAWRWPIGLAPIVAGNLLAWWGAATLSPAATAGLEHRLVEAGPYRFSRNPQYVGNVLILVGVGVIAHSPLVWLALAPVVAACLVAPWAEEPWCAERYGEPYQEYRRRVRRFL
ncbi:hypothetical protein Mal64_17280 [Pseudobythopirellula maris]|uniref:Isoprenylcysteine carboxyl methyltransferase (ICMT) family protein n=1 Tax=Pseudobythopirellula maris TaxID=2527991 RepID=A0A5C5ZLH3_9BACT|nr:PEMT/PEM2 methyltransferase family protein [Pseudobythopirellula maris]TWT88249.1 hypothetical protein Mal64_17280 [Pseudobythopirellula maris]